MKKIFYVMFVLFTYCFGFVDYLMGNDEYFLGRSSNLRFQYGTIISNGESSLNLAREIPKQECKTLAQASSDDYIRQRKYSNHLSAAKIRIDWNNPDAQIHQAYFVGTRTRKTFDWASDSSNSVAYNHVRLNSSSSNTIDSHSGNNATHSEPHMIADIDSLFRKNSDSFVTEFLQNITNVRDEHRSKCTFGISIHSTLDACNDCAADIIKFYDDHRQGQQSIFGKIENELQHKGFSNIDCDFTVLYYSQYPYKYNCDYTISTSDGSIIEGFRADTEYNPRIDYFVTDKEPGVDLSDSHLSQDIIRPVQNYGVIAHICQLEDSSASYAEKTSKGRGFSFSEETRQKTKKEKKAMDDLVKWLEELSISSVSRHSNGDDE